MVTIKSEKEFFEYQCKVCGKTFYREAIPNMVPIGLGKIGGEPIKDYCSYNCYKNRKKAGKDNENK